MDAGLHLTSGLSARSAWSRWYGPVMLGLAAALLLLVAISSVAAWGVATNDPRVYPGIDLDIMRELGRRWLASGTMYLPYQLSGPYSIDATPWAMASTPALYPPAAGPVFGLLSLVPRAVAAPLWWAVPLGVVAAAVARWRPAPWTWPLMALCLVHPYAEMQLIVGGTALWVAAAVAGGLLAGWPGALVLLKPTMLPFALAGVRSRGWWAVAAAVAALTLLGPWRDYLAVAANGSASGDGLLYSLRAFPMTMLPVVAWLGRRRRPVTSGRSRPAPG